jgi:hypothetical protein
MSRFIEFLEDNNKQLSMHRLGMLVGIVVGTLIALGATILYFFYSLDASVFSSIYHVFVGTTSGGYGVGKVMDAFGKEGTDTKEDATDGNDS